MEDLDYAVHHLARNFGRWPWELDDEPADRVMHALGLESADAEGRAMRRREDRLERDRGR